MWLYELGLNLENLAIIFLNPVWEIEVDNVNFIDNFLDLGKTLKAIRISRKMTQEMLAGGVNSRSALSKFEMGQKTVYLDTFLAYLHRLDMTFEEFMFVHNDYVASEKDQLYDELLRHFSVHQTIISDELKEKINQYTKTQRENPYIAVFDQYYQQYNDIQSDDKNSQDYFLEKRRLAEKLWSMIKELGQWYLREIKLLILIVTYLPTPEAIDLSNKLMSRLKVYKNHPLYNELFIAFKLNISLKLIKNGALEEAKKVIEKVREKVPYTKRVDYEAISKIRYGESGFDEDQVHEGFVMLTHFGNETILSGMMVEIIDFYPGYYFKNRKGILKSENTELILKRLEDDYLIFVDA